MNNPQAVSLSLPKHPEFSYSLHLVGAEREPVLVVDNLMANADQLVDWAANQARFSPSRNYYPGQLAPAPQLYAVYLCNALRLPMAEAFGLVERNVVGVKCDFSMVTQRFEDLGPLHRIPHFDSNQRQDLAAVHYLCTADKGGTSLYRHKSSGFEYVDESRRETYIGRAQQEGLLVTTEGGFINGDNQFYERIFQVEASFNRLVMYRCTSLHSANIAEHFNFDPDPRHGRLTLNSFIFSKP